MWRRQPRARLFLIAHAQSSLGNGAAYVALLLLAYERFDSALAVALILLADFLPAMVAGPVLGAAVDRWGTRNCAIAADLLRVVSFGLLFMVDGLVPMAGLALLAGAGTALFVPAANAMLPEVTDDDDLPAANAVFGGSVDAGLAIGPLLAAPLLILAGPEWVLLTNAVTFAISAALLRRLPRQAPRRSAGDPDEPLLAAARAGLSIAMRLPVVRTVLAAAAAGVLFGAAVNVGEVALAIDALDVGGSGYAALVAVNAGATVLGALAASGRLESSQLRRRFILGLALEGAALLCAGLAGALATALAAFAAAGFANGFAVTHERTLLQEAAPEHARGRVFGVRDALNAWGFGGAFVAGGVVVEQLGAATVFVIAGVGLVAVACVTAAPLGRAAQRRPALLSSTAS